MTTYIQRQFSSMLIPGSGTSATAKSITERILDLSDVYPANILKLGEGQYSTGVRKLTSALPLPRLFLADGVQKLHLTIIVDALCSVLTQVAANPGTVTMIQATPTSHGIFSVVGGISAAPTVTPVTTANYSFFMFVYPDDITLSTAWRSGAQTIGHL